MGGLSTERGWPQVCIGWIIKCNTRVLILERWGWGGRGGYVICHTYASTHSYINTTTCRLYPPPPSCILLSISFLLHTLESDCLFTLRKDRSLLRMESTLFSEWTNYRMDSETFMFSFHILTYWHCIKCGIGTFHPSLCAMLDTMELTTC